jgi:hypothetical protein
MEKPMDNISLEDELMEKILAYYDTIWRDSPNNIRPEEWLKNFTGEITNDIEEEKSHALFLLSKFMYFGNKEIRELLKCIYRDLFKYPIIAEIREKKEDTTDTDYLNEEYNKELKRSRFLGVGNPSESGVHLLYYFRQENSITRENFINMHEIFNIHNDKLEIIDKDIKRYIFIDDFCGGGTQAKTYLGKWIEKIKNLNSNTKICYYMLFGVESGIKYIEENLRLDEVRAVFTLDDTFKCFSEKSRYFRTKEKEEKKLCEKISENYGKNLFPDAPLGYGGEQLLLSFFHNTPNNTLPIFWSNRNEWKPIFKRYPKRYGGVVNE